MSNIKYLLFQMHFYCYQFKYNCILNILRIIHFFYRHSTKKNTNSSSCQKFKIIIQRQQGCKIVITVKTSRQAYHWLALEQMKEEASTSTPFWIPIRPILSAKWLPHHCNFYFSAVAIVIFFSFEQRRLSRAMYATRLFYSPQFCNHKQINLPVKLSFGEFP